MENQGLPVRLPGRLLDKPPVSVDAYKVGGRGPLLRVNAADGGVGGGNGSESLLEGHESDFSEHSTEAAGLSKRIPGLLEVCQPDSCKFVDSAAAYAGGGVGRSNGNVDLVELPASDDFGDSADAAAPETAVHATAGESKGINGLLVSAHALYFVEFIWECCCGCMCT